LHAVAWVRSHRDGRWSGAAGRSSRRGRDASHDSTISGLGRREIHRRLVSEWGFSPAEVMTRDDGVIGGTDTNVVDGLPVYNA
jgi:hypothetical protein